VSHLRILFIVTAVKISHKIGLLLDLISLYQLRRFFSIGWGGRGVKLLASVDISTRAPWITLNEHLIMACTSIMPIVLGCKIPHELHALKWKAIGRRRRRRRGGGGWGGMDWIDLAQDRDQRALVNMVMNLQVP
jgi:hypothetical protein